jgi:hypothetical protein
MILRKRQPYHLSMSQVVGLLQTTYPELPSDIIVTMAYPHAADPTKLVVIVHSPTLQPIHLDTGEVTWG